MDQYQNIKAINTHVFKLNMLRKQNKKINIFVDIL